MKKKYVISISIILVITLSVSICIFYNHNFSKKEEVNPISENNSNNSNNLVSIMLEKETGTGNYEKSNEGFPTEGYVFNKDLSKCVNGSEIDYENNEVVVKAVGTDKCYAYFDNVQVKTNFEFTGNYEEYIVPTTGTYKIELWGASGGEYYAVDGAKGGKGAYTKGNIKLGKGEKIYVYVGEHPIYTTGDCYSSNSNSSFNGSRSGACVGGGGATDVRLKDGEWDNFEGLMSRIMVAAGGGGGAYIGYGGDGGELVGGNAEGYRTTYADHAGYGATQEKFEFGVSGGKTCIAGNGYYSGEKGFGANAGGGSSFISGYPGCNAIDEKSTEDEIIHTDQPNHYSGKIFTDAEMIAGNETMPSPSGEMEEGHTGNGYAKITFINNNF